MNSDPLKAATLKAVLRLFEPLAQLLLEAGVGVGEVHALAEMAFVRAAQRAHAEIGESDPENVARIAVRTGLTRALVAKLGAAKRDEIPEAKYLQNRAVRVLDAWCQEEAYLDRSGAPLILPIRGPAPSFQTLVRDHSGDALLGHPILKDLQRVGAVRRLPNKHVQLIRRSYARVTWTEAGILALGEEVRDLVQVLTHELQQRDPPQFHRYIENAQLDREHAGILERDFFGNGNSLFNSFHRALSHKTVSAPPDAKQVDRISASIFVRREPAWDAAVSSETSRHRRGTPKAGKAPRSRGTKNR
jgi:hypothetical protein